MRHTVCVLALVAFSACKLKGFGATADGGGPSIVGALASLVAFEGKIDTTVSIPPSSGLSVSYEVKGSKIRTETKGVFGVVNIADMNAKKSWLIDDAAHTYYEVDLERLMSKTTSPKPSTSKARSLGKSDIVAGYSCDLWEVIDGPRYAEVCVASGLSMMALGLSGPFSTFARNDDAWSDVMKRGFPLRMVMSDSSGAVTMKMEATHIEKKSVPDSEFAIPAGYTKTTSPI